MAFQVDACYIIAIRKKQEFSLGSILIIYNNITIAICQVKNRPDSIPNPFMYKYCQVSVTSLFLFIYVNPIASTLHVRSEANDSTTAVIRRFPLGG